MSVIEDLLSPHQPWMEVVSTLQQHGHKAYLVGGCVRDLLLGIRTKDVDVATSALPHQVEAIFPSTIPVGRAFGVIVVLIRSQPVEVATFRKDDVYDDGRHPTNVSFSDEREDARRRDFTINALYLDPVSRSILDTVRGKQDLQARLIRAVGDPEQRFQEDRLRILRAVRFQARLGFRIHPKTQAAIRLFAANLEGISSERIRGELSRMLSDAHAADAFRSLHRLGLLNTVLPPVAELASQPSRFRKGKKSALDDTLHALSWLRPHHETVAWAILLAFIGQKSPSQTLPQVLAASAPMAVEILRAFNASKQLSDDVGIILHNLAICLSTSSLDLGARKRMLMGPAAKDTLETIRILSLAHDTDWLAPWLDLMQLAQNLRLQPPQLSDWVDGHELTQLGYAPGPVMGKILKALQNELLNERIHSKQEALAFVRDHFPITPGEPAEPDSPKRPHRR